MAAKRRKSWSKLLEAHGVKVRLFERTGSSAVWYSIVGEGGRKIRKSLETSDRTLAEDRARLIAAGVASERITPGQAPDALTLDQLRAVYVRERGKLLSDARMVEVRRAFRLLNAHLGSTFRVSDLGPHQVETYSAARRAGELVATGGRNGGGKVGAAAVAREVEILHAALNWAEHYRSLNGKPLLLRNPIRGVSVSSESNPARPVASRGRFEKLLEQADGIDASGAFRTMLYVAWYTGRRLGSIVGLRASDVLLTPEQVRQALATAGREEQEEDEAPAWPAAVRWAAEHDKESVEWIVPIPDVLARTLSEYIRRQALVGRALLFPARKDPSAPLSKETAHHWLRLAETRAGLLRQRQGGWHAFRRAWATARKHMPLQDVMAAGGWRDPGALTRAYQRADAETVRKVMEAE